MQTLGKTLRKARQARGYTLSDVARMVESSLGYIHEIETGKSLPSLKMLEKLDNVLDLTLCLTENIPDKEKKQK